MEFSKYMDLIPKRIPKETKEWVENEVFKKSRYIFIKKEEGKNIGYCTWCKKEYEIDFYHHNEVAHCMNCRSKCTVKLIRYRRNSLKDVATILIYQKTNKYKSEMVNETQERKKILETEIEINQAGLEFLFELWIAFAI